MRGSCTGRGPVIQARQRFRRLQWVCTVALLGLVLAGCDRQAGTPSRVAAAPPLIPGARVERAIAPGESHAYDLILPAGTYLRLALRERGAKVTGLLVAP